MVCAGAGQTAPVKEEDGAARDEAAARAEMSAARAEGTRAPDDRPVLLASSELQVREGALQAARTRLAAAQHEAVATLRI